MRPLPLLTLRFVVASRVADLLVALRLLVFSSETEYLQRARERFISYQKLARLPESETVLSHRHAVRRRPEHGLGIVIERLPGLWRLALEQLDQFYRSKANQHTIVFLRRRMRSRY